MEKENKNRIGLIVLLIAIVLFAGGITFAFFRADVTGEQEKLTVQTGTLALTFSDNNTGITASSLSFGQSTTKEFKIENTGTLPVTTNMLWNNLINTYTEGSLTYTFEYSTNETGPWTAVPNASGNIPQSENASDKTLAPDITIPAKTTYYYQLTITLNHLADVDQTNDKDAVLSSNFKLGDKIIEDRALEILKKLNITSNEGSPDFRTIATTDEGVYSLLDDYGTSYYYRGAVENNYVKFAGFYWRIIRINGDGSLRMIYDGTVAHKNGEGNSTFTTTGVNGSTAGVDRFINNGSRVAFNISANDNVFVGWMYGTTGGTKEHAQTNTTNSNIKNIVNTWYDTNLASYDQYIADSVYCADRTTPGQSITGDSWDTGLGYGANATWYGAGYRFGAANKTMQPQFTCTNKNDAFTVGDSEYGNAIGAAKSRKVGLITVDEVVAAGGSHAYNNYNYYLYKTSSRWYWTMSPRYVSTNGYAGVFAVYDGGGINSYNVNTGTNGSVAPVISLKAEYAAKLQGSGTASDPYIIPGVE